MATQNQHRGKRITKSAHEHFPSSIKQTEVRPDLNDFVTGKSMSVKFEPILKPSLAEHLHTPYIYIRKVLRKNKDKEQDEWEKREKIRRERKRNWDLSNNNHSLRRPESRGRDDDSPEPGSGSNPQSPTQTLERLTSQADRKEKYEENANQRAFVYGFFEKMYQSILKKEQTERDIAASRGSSGKEYDVEPSGDVKAQFRKFLKDKKIPVNKTDKRDVLFGEAKFKEFIHYLGVGRAQKQVKEYTRTGKEVITTVEEGGNEEEEKDLDKFFKTFAENEGGAATVSLKVNMKAFLYNYKKYFGKKFRIRDMISEKAAKQRNIDIRIYIRDFLAAFDSIRSHLAEVKEKETSIGSSIVAFDIAASARPQGGRVVIEDFNSVVDLKDQLLFERKVIVRFLELRNKRSPDTLIDFDTLNVLMNQVIREDRAADLTLIGKFIHEFKREKQLFKEDQFTLFEMVNFIHEKKYTRAQFEILTYFINCLRKSYNKSKSLTKDTYVDPRTPLSNAYLTTTFDRLCTKAEKQSQILERLISDLEVQYQNYRSETATTRTNKIIEYNVLADGILRHLSNLDDDLLVNIDRLEELANYIPKAEDERVPLYEVRSKIYHIITGDDLREEPQQTKKLEGFKQLLKDERSNQRKVEGRDDPKFADSGMRRVNWAVNERDIREEEIPGQLTRLNQGNTIAAAPIGVHGDAPGILYNNYQGDVQQDRRDVEEWRVGSDSHAPNRYGHHHHQQQQQQQYQEVSRDRISQRDEWSQKRELDPKQKDVDNFNWIKALGREEERKPNLETNNGPQNSALGESLLIRDDAAEKLLKQGYDDRYDNVNRGHISAANPNFNIQSSTNRKEEDEVDNFIDLLNNKKPEGKNSKRETLESFKFSGNNFNNMEPLNYQQMGRLPAEQLAYKGQLEKINNLDRVSDNYREFYDKASAFEQPQVSQAQRSKELFYSSEKGGTGQHSNYRPTDKVFTEQLAHKGQSGQQNNLNRASENYRGIHANSSFEQSHSSKGNFYPSERGRPQHDINYQSTDKLSADQLIHRGQLGQPNNLERTPDNYRGLYENSSILDQSQVPQIQSSKEMFYPSERGVTGYDSIHQPVDKYSIEQLIHRGQTERPNSLDGASNNYRGFYENSSALDQSHVPQVQNSKESFFTSGREKAGYVSNAFKENRPEADAVKNLSSFKTSFLDGLRTIVYESDKKPSTVVTHSESPENIKNSILLKNEALSKTLENCQNPNFLTKSALRGRTDDAVVVPDTVNFGRDKPKLGRFSDYEMLMPADYYTFLAKKNVEMDKDPWYIRSHHIETLTEHPKSVKDNILGAGYTSYYSELPKDSATAAKEKEIIGFSDKNALIQSLQENRLRLKEELDSRQQARVERGQLMNSSGITESKGMKEISKYYDNRDTKEGPGLMVKAYEGILDELRAKERDLLNKKRGEELEKLKPPPNKWWELKDKTFIDEYTKHVFMAQSDPMRVDEYLRHVEELSMKELI